MYFYKIVLSYMGMCHCERYSLQTAYSRIRYRNERVLVENRPNFTGKLISGMKIIDFLENRKAVLR